MELFGRHVPGSAHDRHPHVAVLLGTDHHPFDRLVGWAATLAHESGLTWFVQHGSTSLPEGLPGRRMLGARELARMLDGVEVVITHGGPGLIMEARNARHVPIVVPRDPALGEHVDGHQLSFASRLEALGTIHRVESLEELREAVALARHVGRTEQRGGDDRAETTRRFGELVEQLHRQRLGA